jgi:hypothetical protein
MIGWIVKAEARCCSIFAPARLTAGRQAGTAGADQAGSANCPLAADVLIVGTAGSDLGRMRTMVFLPM